MSKRPQQVSLFLDAAQSTSSEVRSDFQTWFSPGFQMQSRQARSDPLHGISIPKSSIIGFDFAVTLSSPASCCVLFDIALRLLMELKWLMLNKHKRWFHSSRVKFPLVSMSASWFLVSMYLIWILGSKLILSSNQLKSNSVGSGNMSHCRASSLDDHLDDSFIVFKDLQQSFLTRRIDVWRNKTNIVQIINLSINFSFALEIYTGLSVLDYSDACFREELWRSDAVIPSIQSPTSKKWFLILLNCAKLKFVSYTSSWLEQKRVASENTQCSNWWRFWILKIASKIWVLEQTQ